MAKDPTEWLRQADYDLDTAEYMYAGGRFFYAVFMCHLSIEKALKAVYLDRLKTEPPKTHNLIFLTTTGGLKPPEDAGKFLIRLNEASVVTRYPEELNMLQKNFTQPVVKEIITKSRNVLAWIKTQL